MSRSVGGLPFCRKRSGTSSAGAAGQARRRSPRPWLRFQRDTAVAATTVGRWLASARARCIGDLETADDFDAVAALGELRARDRELRFSRLAVSSIDEYGYHVLRLRADGATIGECHRTLRDEHGLRVDRSTVSRWLRRHANGQP